MTKGSKAKILYTYIQQDVMRGNPVLKQHYNHGVHYHNWYTI